MAGKTHPHGGGGHSICVCDRRVHSGYCVCYMRRVGLAARAIKIDLRAALHFQQSFIMYILYIVPDAAAKAAYDAFSVAYLSKPYHERDAGFDLCSAATLIAPSSANLASEKILQQVVAACYDTDRRIFRAYWMLPRSSISKTPLRLANSVGLIDAGYRGPIMAPVHNIHNAPYTVNANDRLFQLATPDLLPWDEIRIVAEIPGGPTLRGAGGFGSTG